MDWIKQIIECKKENWVSPGSLGQKIKKIRMLRKYTQKELGVMCGFSFSSADVRIAQYEKNKKIPREKILKDMCNALGVGEGALIHADMLSYQEMFYALFDMEDFHGLRPVKKEDGYYLKFDSDSIINDFLEKWYKIQDINYNDEKAAGEALVQACTNMKKEHTDAANIGTFKGFKMKASYSLFDNSFYVKLTRESSVSVEIKKDPVKNIERILTALKKMPGQKAVAEERLEDARQQFAQAKEEVQKPFDKEDELKYVQNRLTKINAELDMEPKTEPKLVKKEELKKCL